MTSLPRISIFISSPSDVGSERALAMRVLERLQLEFRGRVELAPIFWEHEVLMNARKASTASNAMETMQVEPGPLGIESEPVARP